MIGGVLAIGTAVAIIAYLLQSTASAHPVFLGTVCVIWAIASCGMFALPRRRMVASRWREPFFLFWSLLVVGSIAFGVVLESRPNTPLLFGFILPLIFSAISYPVVATAIVGSLVLAFAAAAGALTGQSAADLTFQLMALAFAAVMGVWQAYGRERRAEQLVDRARPRAAVPRRRRHDDRPARRPTAWSSASTAARCEVLGYERERAARPRLVRRSPSRTTSGASARERFERGARRHHAPSPTERENAADHPRRRAPLGRLERPPRPDPHRPRAC